MLGLMQDWPLLIHRVIDYAAIQHPERAVISRRVEGDVHHTNYREIRTRALKLAQRLQRDGVKLGDRVGTLAWNTSRHLESWYGITGIGAVCHTLNPRLFEDQLIYIANHAEDKILFLDLTFVPLVEKIADRLPHVERYIVFTDAAHMPETKLKNAIAYEDYIAEADGDFKWLSFDENTAAGMCYTSGTTGHPKGVVYSHRSNVLHAMMACMADGLNISSRDRVMMVVPMFHANSWSLAYSAPMAGSALILPGQKLDGASVYDLIEKEGVTFTAAVPTVWLGLLQYLEANNKKLTKLKRVAIGGSACPRAVAEAFEQKYGVEVIHAWGMTETSPLGSLCTLKPEVAHLEGSALYDLKQKQGFATFTNEMKITDDDGRNLPWDGTTFGHLKVRGPAVSKAYYGNSDDLLDEDGFFDTGDVATIDPQGYMQITDRAKDVIKSGGEWISSIDLENIAVGHPDVAEAAVIGIPHPKWGERPLLLIVSKKDHAPTKEAILAFIKDKVASWWMPDEVRFIDEIPHTATGKISKKTLREQFKDFQFKQ